ncbi:16S rRNA (guanine(966)-N(2))-methyltransferase RsmD [Alicyclobacillus cycloheptanicus]|uniref:16S rRNA (Guanine966-N2)-methyltransferase n=1 Tax=Alicyclobacillus cycloheptanicus TaxID=1457 RepID=A0ABT9XKM9_9BACL|nr:16S rRNA (guanine(966)-N(2))-methyltransferase RsmD [Alicyclobacillus cycloheptanicus]MDQ0190857.1 16S rRNA (guanine966-N2)-methyltransferase [Alicyclobacillus cycloheptanicus]WDM01447.1 16S rRNA (guanine(966)-N(2))-methyltransferase RsmD [Alicyclobacillus cycloheptanicus]
MGTSQCLRDDGGERGECVRVIAGEWKGLRLTAPAGKVARPTTDRVKESMFNLLGLDWPDGAVVDLFAGSGALGLEALSRGAQHAFFIDASHKSIRAVQDNVSRCRASARASIWQMDWRAGWNRVLAEQTVVDWVFVDPPYALDLWDDVLQTLGTHPGMLTHGVVCEHPSDRELLDTYACLVKWKSRTYGDIRVTIYRREADRPDGRAPSQ